MTAELAGKRVILGVTGGVAAYKAVELARRLVDAGAYVVPVMTAAATRFVGETTMSALCSEPVHTKLWDDPTTPIPHTKLGQNADLVVIAPATAKTLAAIRLGYAHDLLTNVVLATRAPLVVCPAMHTEMWEHPAVVDNVAVLRSRGVHIVEPEVGRLAGGDSGAGRLADPQHIVAALRAVFVDPSLTGHHVVVSAGGTREPIDSVRVITNRSSGKQGFALAAEAVSRGARVTLVTTLAPPSDIAARVEVVSVDTCAQMQAAMERCSASADIVVMAAAVADFRPVAPAGHKLKKRDGVPAIALEPTPDILAGLGEHKPDGQTLVGFAAETDDVIENAKMKLARKRLDMIVANDVGADQTGFDHDTNAVTILTNACEPVTVALATKRDVAAAVFDQIISLRSSHDRDKS